MRWFFAVAFVALTAAALYVVPEDWKRHHETAWIVAIAALYFATGILVGRWWALLLAFVPVVVAIPAGDRGDADGTPVWWWVLVDTGYIFVWVVLAGLLVGWGWRRLRAGSPQPAPR